MTVKLFLDANILLDFYRFGKDDIEEIRKLTLLIREGEIDFFKNRLIEEEVRRARDGVLASAFSEFSTSKFQAKIPSFCQDIDGMDRFLDALKATNEAHKDIASQVRKKIEDSDLEADKIINELFGLAKEIEISEEILNRAKHRTSINHPPRKAKDSVADSIHWESLLSIANGISFHLVTRDGDFSSELNPKSIKSFLQAEWKAKHGRCAKIYLHGSLSEFFRQKFPSIKLSYISEVNALVERLVDSPNFATTHLVIAELAKFESFTRNQIQRIFSALLSNKQVRWIATDDDVRQFYTSLQDQAVHLPTAMQSEAANALELDEDFFVLF